MKDNKPKFTYHQNSVEYIAKQLLDINLDTNSSDLILQNYSTKKQIIDNSNAINNKDDWSWGWELNPYKAALQATASAIRPPQHRKLRVGYIKIFAAG